MTRKVLVIVGPTAVGKTGLALDLAKDVPSEIVSADSRQIYKYMTIGTAKPTPSELSAVPHHFIDFLFPDQEYSAGQFGSDARACIEEIFRRRQLPLVVGGSGLYIRGLLDGFFVPRIADAEVKLRLKQQVDELGLEKVYERLQRVDPQSARKLFATDTQRIVRALEVYELTGVPISKLQKQTPDKANFDFSIIGVTMDRQRLYDRIERRVDKMLDDGLMAEVENLRKMGYGPELNALRTVGYREMFRHLDGELTLKEAIELIKQKSRNYAKRQLTWFRNDKRVQWFEMSDDLASRILELIIDN